METNVVTFILENIFIFLPLWIIALVITLVLLFTGKKQSLPVHEMKINEYLTFSTVKINQYHLVYLIIWTIMIIIGFASQIYLSTFIGGIIALIPILLILYLEKTRMQPKG